MHRLELGTGRDSPLVYGVKQYGYVSETDIRAPFYSEAIQQQADYKISKRKPRERRYRVGPACGIEGND